MQAFAKAVKAKDSGVQTRKSIRSERKMESSGSEDEKKVSSDDGEVSDVVPQKLPVSLTVGFSFPTDDNLQMNARKSIMAFLQDQSDEDK